MPVTVPSALAATIYLFNVERWLDDRTERLPREELLDLRSRLELLTRRDDGSTVSWIVRQLGVPA